MIAVVTGGCGFIGRHLLRHLEAHGWQVQVLDRADEYPTHLDFECPPLDHASAIFHLAAYADISRNWVSRAEREVLYRDNLDATINVLERARKARCPFVFVSSACVTHDASLSPYAATKLAGEVLTQAYLGDRARVVRLVSCVGEGYSHGHIADFVEQAKRTGKIHALDDGAAPKSFVHVEDAAAAIYRAATFAGVPPISHVACSPWSWRDTVALMGVEFTNEKRVAGWVGDPVGLHVESDHPCRRTVQEGVQEALASLGWRRT